MLDERVMREQKEDMTEKSKVPHQFIIYAMYVCIITSIQSIYTVMRVSFFSRQIAINPSPLMELSIQQEASKATRMTLV